MVKPIEIRPAQDTMIFACLICNLKQPDRQRNSQFGFFSRATASCLCQQATSRPLLPIRPCRLNSGYSADTRRIEANAFERQVRYLGVEVDEGLEIANQKGVMIGWLHVLAVGASGGRERTNV